MQLVEGQFYTIFGTNGMMEIPSHYRGEFVDENFQSPSHRKVLYIFESELESPFHRWLGCKVGARVLKSGQCLPFFQVITSSNEIENLTYNRGKTGLPLWVKSGE